jgi:3-hydroxyisobutyrate dehydrogenase-like beta-hydroxyacid dehydrogenase
MVNRLQVTLPPRHSAARKHTTVTRSRDEARPSRSAFSTDYALKDLSYALELAAAAEVAARGAELVHHVLTAARDAGWASQYFPVLRRLVGPPGEAPADGSTRNSSASRLRP